MAGNHQTEIQKEIDLVQDCIKRMSNNSFLIKGWTITLVVAVIGIFSQNISNNILFRILALIIVSFWSLDSFYLYVERSYREIYKWIIVERPKGNMDKIYDLNRRRYKCGMKWYIQSMLAPTEFLFYIMPFIAVFIIA